MFNEHGKTLPSKKNRRINMAELMKPDGVTDVEVLPSFDFIFDQENATQSVLAEHRAWLKSIKHERPAPGHPFKVAVYIRYFNQTRYDNYLDKHKQQFLDTIGLCPKWEFVGFYIDEGGTAPNMESAPEWSRLLQDSFDGTVDLIITQKTSNISKKQSELTFCSRILAALPKPVGIYFISEDIFTLASYYQEDLRDPFFYPSDDWKLLPDDDSQMRRMLHD